MKKILCIIALMLAVVCLLTSCNIQIGTPNQAEAPTISISEDGYWIINGEKTDVKAQGEKGEKGDKGDNGEGATESYENPQGLAFFLKDDGTYMVKIGNATYLSKIEIPATYKGRAVTEVGSFHNSSYLKEITIPDSVISIGDFAFSNCSKLTSVTIGDSVTTIGDYAFCECTNLTSVTIGNSVTTIGDMAFYCCSNLTSVTIPDSVTTIGYEAFAGCDNLTSVTIGNSVTTIGYGAFQNCSNLTSVTIGDSVTTIGYEAFAGCDNLTSVTIPDSVTTIGDSAFSGCSNLTSVIFANPNGWECKDFYNSANITAISASDLSNPSTAAQYLKFTYYDFCWFRTE